MPPFPRLGQFNPPGITPQEALTNYLRYVRGYHGAGKSPSDEEIGVLRELSEQVLRLGGRLGELPAQKEEI